MSTPKPQPLFRLDNMPPDSIFVESISFDHFGHRAFHEHTPAQFRYDWRAPPPPPLPDSLVAYNRYNIRSSTNSVHDLLGIPVANPSFERVRTALVELLVAGCMAERCVGHDVRVLESVPDRDHIPQSMLELALSLVNFAVGSPISSPPRALFDDTVCDFIWIRKDVCLRITTHLDDEDILKASIGDLVHHIDTTWDKVGTVYGIACSIFHCAIVRVNKDEPGTSFAHTPALQFLPSFYATTMYTPGIEALSRLGCQASGVEILNAISDANHRRLPRVTHKELLVTGSVAAKVPVEVWSRVGEFITSPDDLVTLASISQRATAAATDIARYPWVEKFRLVDVVSRGPVLPIPDTTDSSDVSGPDDNVLRYLYELGRTKFTAVRGGRRVNVELGQNNDKTFAGRRKISFGVENYHFGGCVRVALYILELDDD